MHGIRLSKLITNPDWEALAIQLDPSSRVLGVHNVVRQLRELGARSVLVEDEYLDQDFTATYSVFYSTVFKRHTKVCKRFHFFKADIFPLINDADAVGSAIKLEEIAETDYLGFVVLRPVSHAPLGRVVLPLPTAPVGLVSELLVYASYEAHVLGAVFRLRGIALTQQDARVGACAQAAIWMAGRHLHMRHRGPWFSTVAITQAATTLTDANITQSLPAGSEFLSPDNMIRALRAMRCEPFVYAAEPDNNAPGGFRWTIPHRPEDIIGRYVDSGIPVIIGLTALPGQSVGHAVVVTGRVIKGLDPTANLPNRPTYSSFCAHFLINDDQLARIIHQAA